MIPSEAWRVSGWAKGRIASLPYFSLANGSGGVATSASAKSCKSVGSSSSDVTTLFDAGIRMPFFKGVATVFVNGTYAMAGHLALAPGTCTLNGRLSHAYCDRDVSTYVYVVLTLLDFTTGTWYSSNVSTDFILGNSSYDDTVRSGTSSSTTRAGGSGPTSAAGGFAYMFTLTPGMVRNNTYGLSIWVVSGSYAECSAFNYHLTGCAISTSVNFATLGNGLVLNSIVLT